jgi:hypothetical protein
MKNKQKQNPIMVTNITNITPMSLSVENLQKMRMLGACDETEHY